MSGRQSPAERVRQDIVVLGGRPGAAEAGWCSMKMKPANGFVQQGLIAMGLETACG